MNYCKQLGILNASLLLTALVVRARRVRDRDDELLLEEALAVEWMINTSGQIQIVGKELIRKELGRSLDRLDSVVIGLSQTVGGMRHVVRVGTVSDLRPA